MEGEQKLPFWRVNVPKDQWPSECPEYLKGLSEKDVGIINTPDKDYHKLTWPEVQDLISTRSLCTLPAQKLTETREQKT